MSELTENVTEDKTKTLINELLSLAKEAAEKNLYIYASHGNIIFNAQQFKDCILNGRFIWGLVNFKAMTKNEIKELKGVKFMSFYTSNDEMDEFTGRLEA